MHGNIRLILKKVESSRSFYSLVGLLGLMLLAGVFIPEFRTISNFVTVLRQSCVLLMLSCGLTAVILTGNMDLSVGATAGLAGCVCAKLMKAGSPLSLVVLAGIIITARLNAAEASMGSAYGLQTTAAVIVGGTSIMGGEGGVAGTVIGAILLTVITNVMNLIGITSDAQSLVIGVVIIAMVAIDSLSRIRRKNVIGKVEEA